MGAKLFGLRDNKLFINPVIEDDIDFIDLKIPVPQGSVEVSFKRDNGRKIYSVKSPETREIVFEGEGYELKGK